MLRMKKTLMGIMVATVCLGLGGQALAGVDGGRLLKSVVFPGMGQLGDDQVFRGLAYMTLETVCLSLMFGEVSKRESFARETEYLQVKYQMADTYEEREAEYVNWQNAFDKSAASQTMVIVYGGAAGVVWAWNIVDALLFAPKDRESSLYRTIRENTLVSVTPEKALLSYRVTF